MKQICVLRRDLIKTGFFVPVGDTYIGNGQYKYCTLNNGLAI